jgi:hypothetical protein
VESLCNLNFDSIRHDFKTQLAEAKERNPKEWREGRDAIIESLAMRQSRDPDGPREQRFESHPNKAAADFQTGKLPGLQVNGWTANYSKTLLWGTNIESAGSWGRNSIN